MKRIISLLRRTRFQVSLGDMALKFVLGIGGSVATIMMIAVSAVCMRNQKYFVALTVFVGAIVVAWVIFVDLFEKTTRRKVRRKTFVRSEPQESRMWLDEEDGDGEQDEKWREEIGQEEEYEPIISRTINPDKKRIIHSNGTLGYKPVGELNLPQAALNFLVATFPFPEPKIPQNNSKTPEQ